MACHFSVNVIVPEAVDIPRMHLARKFHDSFELRYPLALLPSAVLPKAMVSKLMKTFVCVMPLSESHQSLTLL